MIFFIEGTAGSGKTHNLIAKLEEECLNDPLQSHQKVLALTFMHGSRRRLFDKLIKIQSLRKVIDCRTIDSLAALLVSKWRSLASKMELPEATNFDEQCRNGGSLLSNQAVQKWLASSYPMVLIDEAQDMSDERLSMIRELSKVSRCFFAADEFQLLQTEEKKYEVIDWLRSNCKPLQLSGNRRTSDSGLIKVSGTLRDGIGLLSVLNKKSTSGKYRETYYECGEFKLVIDGSAKAKQLGQWKLWNEIRLRADDSIAILTPSKCTYVVQAVEAVTKGIATKQGGKVTPYSIFWEEQEQSIDVIDYFESDTIKYQQLLSDLSQMTFPCKLQLEKWITKRHNIAGQDDFSKIQLKEKLRELLSYRVNYSQRRQIAQQ